MNFGDVFATADAAIMDAVGDDITLTPTAGAAINARCVLAARPGKNNQDGFSWLDNIAAKIDIYSVIVELPESSAPNIGKDWSALYLGKTYTVSDFMPKGDGMLIVILNPAGNTVATPAGWK